MDLIGYPTELITGFTLIGYFVVFIVVCILVGIFQAIGADIWQRFKKKK